MDAEYFWIECAGCRLTWKMSLMECEVGQLLACPFCGNQHFEAKTVTPGVFTSHTGNWEEHLDHKVRRLLEKESRFTWL